MSSWLVVVLEGVIVVLFLAVFLLYFFLRETGKVPWEKEKIEKMPPEIQEALVVAIFKISLIQAVGALAMLLALAVFYVYRNDAQIVGMLAAVIATATIYLLIETYRTKRL